MSQKDALVREVLKVTKAVEEEIDLNIQKLDAVRTGDDIDSLRSERLKKMKKDALQKNEWLSKGHGKYEDIEEKDFFNIIKESDRIVLHFYRSETARCKIFDHHLKLLAPQHVETKFVKIDATKCPFLTGRLQVKVLPTLLMILNGEVKGMLIGFSELGNTDEFSTEVLQWRLGQFAVINYDGDLFNPPDMKKPEKMFCSRIRVSKYNDSDSHSD
ncbi:hypothetical protein AAG570_000185 [Ranatra chinensis]|uniref:Thioredoxin domain-containing protein 9 n=1 Tax=Ranatra chinensis TaxID=642074 RepID=A0ABD0YWC2_9HEMI